METIIIAYYLTDFITAIVHFTIEYYPAEDWKPTSESMITELHHTDVLNYSDFSYADFFTFTYPGTLPLLILSLFLESRFASTLILFCSFFGVLSPLSHCWAHERSHGIKIPKIASFLQDIGILMSPRHHNMHHFKNSEKYFGFLSGNTDFLTNLFLKKPKHLQEKYPIERTKYIGNLIANRINQYRETGSHSFPSSLLPDSSLILKNK